MFVLNLDLDEFNELRDLLARTVTQDTPYLNTIHNKLFHPNEHPTEQNYPLQTARFREILDEMYQVHLDKNRDYSPINILGVGIVGIVTRIWDKTSRICSLLGWNLQTGEFSSERKSVNDESIEDNLKDLGIYSIIARIYREGKWGK